MHWDDAWLLRGTYAPEGCGRSEVDFSNLRRLAALHLVMLNSDEMVVT